MAGSGTAHLRPGEVLLRAEHLVVEFPMAHGVKVRAVSDVSLDVMEGETLGLVGESGCGKSTTGHALVRLIEPTGGRVEFEGRDLATMSSKDRRAVQARLQMIFQDPVASLNPWRKVLDVVAEPLRIWKLGSNADQLAKAGAMLESVGIDPEAAGARRPSQLSGGQCQRVAIARSVILEPRLIICDEPVSSLDVSVQAQIINLLEEMKERYGLSLVFIAHDLAVVKKVSDRIMVMYLGKVCEVAASDDLYRSPQHPYTALLLSAIPDPDPDAVVVPFPELASELPSPLNPPSGCRFRTRCPRADERCAAEEPQIRAVAEQHFVACHHPLEVSSAVPAPRLAGASAAAVDRSPASSDHGEQ